MYRNAGSFGPLPNNSVGTSLLPCPFGSPCALFRDAFSYRIYNPNAPATTAVKPPNAAEVARAGMYLGSSLAEKMLPEIKPAALAIPTMTPVNTTRLFSDMELLEYQVASRTEGVLLPMQSKKQAKYATPMLCRTSMVPRITNQTIVIKRGMTMCRARSRK